MKLILNLTLNMFINYILLKKISISPHLNEIILLI